MDLKTRLLKWIEKCRTSWKTLDEVSEWNSWSDVVKNGKTLYSLIDQLVLMAESLASTMTDLPSSAEKRQAVVDMLDRLIPLPFWAEWADGPIVGFLVDMVVSRLNNLHGHIWPVEATKEAVTGDQVAALAERATPLTKEEAAAVVEGFREELLKKAPKCSSPATNRFAQCLGAVFGYEGGYVNDPNDHGGATNMGITEATFKKAKAAGIIHSSSVKNLTRSEAETIYRKYYWDPIGGDRLPPPLDIVLFDAAVNCGVGAAVKLLQEALNELLPGTPLVVDGGYGPKTLAALTQAKTATADPIRFLALDAITNRVELYDSIVTNNASQRTFLRGWIHRAVDLVKKAGLDG